MSRLVLFNSALAVTAVGLLAGFGRPRKTQPNVIVGGGAAAVSAAEAIALDPHALVLLISEEIAPYEKPPLSKEMWAQTAGKDTYLDWNGNRKGIHAKNINVVKSPLELIPGKLNLLHGKAIAIDIEARTVKVADFDVPYSKLLIATGGSPKTLPFIKDLPAESLKHVSTFRTVEDFHALQNIATGEKTIAVIGGGFLGSEISVALAQYSKSLKIIQIFPEEGNMDLLLPKYLSKWTTTQMRKEGVIVLPGSVVVGVSPIDHKLSINMKEGPSVVADHVVVAVGLTPNVDLAQKAGLEIDPLLGGIIVNAELETRSDIFAAGDCTSYHDIALGRRRVEHYDHAVQSGKTAGLNMISGDKKPYTHQSMFWSNLGPNVSYEAVGILNSKSPTVSIWSKTLGKPESQKDEKHDKGAVYYLDDEKRVTGVLLWNLHDHSNLTKAREIIGKRQKHDAKDLATLIDVNQN